MLNLLAAKAWDRAVHQPEQVRLCRAASPSSHPRKGSKQQEFKADLHRALQSPGPIISFVLSYFTGDDSIH